MWVEEPTLAAIWTEIGAAEAPALDAAAAGRPRMCFACSGELEPRALFGVPVGRCPAHGLWFDFDELLAAVGRTIDPQRRWLTALVSALDAGAEYVAAPPESGCLSCRRRLVMVPGLEGRFLRCAQCGSAFVDRRALQNMWRDMSPTAPQPVLAPRVGGASRRCVICARPMIPASLHLVPVDECPIHGIWFDADELATTLAAAVLPDKAWLEVFSGMLATMS